MLPTSSLQPSWRGTPMPSHTQAAMASTSAAPSPAPHLPLSFDAGYRDIFDAPERPREPSTHVRFAAASPSRAAYASSRTARPAPSSLPPPVMFDGPARPVPRRDASAPYRAYRAYPSKVWPIPAARGRSKASMAMSMVPLVVSGIGVGVLFGVD